mmetsp:Transcript_44916/g.139193  ORF Transcript_44916/g.139193 Transcript_44916/m.139193 type:complete len:148 (-) Transcript_44916:1659-2102(-)
MSHEARTSRSLEWDGTCPKSVLGDCETRGDSPSRGERPSAPASAPSRGIRDARLFLVGNTTREEASSVSDAAFGGAAAVAAGPEAVSGDGLGGGKGGSGVLGVPQKSSTGSWPSSSKKPAAPGEPGDATGVDGATDVSGNLSARGRS